MPIPRLTGLLLAACVAAGLFACSRTAEDPLRAADGILRFVPADTPYVFAAAEPMPADVLDKFEPLVETMLSMYQDVARSMLDGARAEAGPDAASADTETGIALVEELVGLLSLQELRAAGLSRDARGAFYGVGLLPVLRVELSDPAAFEALIRRLEEKAGASLATGTLGSHTYRYAGDDDFRGVLAIIDGHLVVTTVPATFSEELLGRVLGVELPARSLAASGRLAETARTYGYTPHALGFLDVERIVATALDPAPGIDAELLIDLEQQRAELSDICRAEIRELAGVMPKVVTGYTEISAARLRSKTVLELRSDLATGFASIAAPVPGLGMDHGGLASFGMSLDLLAARAFYSARLDAMEADPYRCELFADSREAVAQGRELLNQAVPPIVYSFKGVVAVLDRIEGLDLASQQPPTSVDMRLLVATENAEGLLAMAAMFSPEVAALGLKADGKPVRLDLPQVGGPVESAYVAMTGNALAMAVGEGGESRLVDLLAAPAGDPPPFVSVHGDMKSYYDLLGQSVLAANGDGTADALSPEARAAIGGAMTELGAVISRMSLDIVFTDRGIEIPATVTLAD